MNRSSPNLGGQISIVAAPDAILWYRYVALFQNKGGSKTSGVEDRGQIPHFLTPVKITEDVRENAKWENQDDLMRPALR